MTANFNENLVVNYSEWHTFPCPGFLYFDENQPICEMCRVHFAKGDTAAVLGCGKHMYHEVCYTDFRPNGWSCPNSWCCPFCDNYLLFDEARGATVLNRSKIMIWDNDFVEFQGLLDYFEAQLGREVNQVELYAGGSRKEVMCDVKLKGRILRINPRNQMNIQLKNAYNQGVVNDQQIEDLPMEYLTCASTYEWMTSSKEHFYHLNELVEDKLPGVASDEEED